MVEVQKLRTLCGDSRGRGSKTEDFLRFLRSARDPLRALAVAPCEFVLVSANLLRRLCVSKRSRCCAVHFSCSQSGLRKLSRGLRACLRNPLVACSIPPWSAAAPAKIAAFLSNVVRGACSCSSGCKIATF